MYTKYEKCGKVYNQAGKDLIMRILTILTSGLLYKLYGYLDEQSRY